MGHTVKATEIVLVITTLGGVVFGAIERMEKYEQAKNHNHVVAEIAEAAQASGEQAR
jgi:hypothetical protein